ncbi:MAG: helix-turn-helix domain-containing protein [Nitrososphaeraceae archaeon]|nr:helix-turn-helix domain-containing protein [Nitrososphaeraceae archaeon]
MIDICIRYQISRKIYYKWKNRYLKYGIEGLHDKSTKPHNIQPGKVTKEIEQEILNLRTTKRFGCNRIKIRLKRLKEVSLMHQNHIQYTEKTWFEYLFM